MQRKTVIKQEEVAIEIGKREKIISAIAEGSGTVDQAGAENVALTGTIAADIDVSSEGLPCDFKHKIHSGNLKEG